MKIFVPTINSNEEDYKIVKWNFKSKDKVKKKDILVIIESTKVAEEIDCEYEGYIKIFYQEGETVKAGTCIAEIFKDIEKIKEDKTNNIKKLNDCIFTLKAKKLIDENNLNLEIFSAKNLVKESDVLEYLKNNSNIKKKKESFIIIFFKEKKPYHAAIYIEDKGVVDLSLLGNRFIKAKEYNFDDFDLRFFQLDIINLDRIIKFLSKPALLTDKIIKKEKSSRGWFKSAESPNYILKFRDKRSKNPKDVNCIEWLVLALEEASIILPDNVLTAERLFFWAQKNLKEINKDKHSFQTDYK